MSDIRDSNNNTNLRNLWTIPGTTSWKLVGRVSQDLSSRARSRHLLLSRQKGFPKRVCRKAGRDFSTPLRSARNDRESICG